MMMLSWCYVFIIMFKYDYSEVNELQLRIGRILQTWTASPLTENSQINKWQIAAGALSRTAILGRYHPYPPGLNSKLVIRSTVLTNIMLVVIIIASLLIVM